MLNTIAFVIFVAGAWVFGVALFILHAWAVLDREGSGPC